VRSSYGSRLSRGCGRRSGMKRDQGMQRKPGDEMKRSLFAMVTAIALGIPRGFVSPVSKDAAQLGSRFGPIRALSWADADRGARRRGAASPTVFAPHSVALSSPA
jgi:hypothetical protein